MAKSKSDTTDAERADYMEAGMTMDHFLSHAIALLQTRSGLTTDQAETLAINVQIPQLQAEQAKIRAEIAAFLAETSEINPPTDAQVTDIQNRSQQLDAMTANSNNANSILTLVTAALTTWNQTHAT